MANRPAKKSCVVVGAGIAGLATARALQSAGWAVQAIERRPTLPAEGATITLWPNGVKCLKALGVRAEDHGIPLLSMRVSTLNGRLLGRLPMFHMLETHGVPVVPVVRQQLLAALADGLPAGQLRLGEQVARILSNSDDGIVLETGSGDQISADLLVVADGVNSRLRSQLVGPVPVRSASVFNWLGNVSTRLPGLEDGEGVEYLGPDRRLGLIPLKNGTYFRLSEYSTDRPILTPGQGGALVQERLRASFAAAQPDDVTALLHALDTIDETYLYIAEERDIDPLPFWCAGSAVMVGDAAHAMTSGLGQGGNQALEDALELANTLFDHGNVVATALPDFEARRRDRVDPLVLASREKVELFQPATPHILERWYDGMGDISSPGSMSTFDDIMHGLGTPVLNAAV